MVHETKEQSELQRMSATHKDIMSVPRLLAFPTLIAHSGFLIVLPHYKQNEIEVNRR